MRKGKGDLTHAERLEIGILLSKGYQSREIGGVLGRGKSTINYEISQNQTKGQYDPQKAHEKARLRKRMRRLEWSKIEQFPSLKHLIIAKLSEHWNPDEIAGWLKLRKQPYVSKTAIYAWLRTSRGERYCQFLYSKRKRVRRRRKKTKRALIPNRVGIERRNRGATNRTHYGHFEADTIVGRKGTRGGLKTAVERKSRLVVAGKVKTMKPDEHATVLSELLLPLKIKSATFDNGIENREHGTLGCPTFFCDPYASWQKGSIENANKMIRRYFPKGTDFNLVSQTKIDRVVAIINNKPRKILGYRSAWEVAQATDIIKSEVA